MRVSAFGCLLLEDRIGEGLDSFFFIMFIVEGDCRIGKVVWACRSLITLKCAFATATDRGWHGNTRSQKRYRLRP